MNADLRGALKKINKVWHLFEHKGKILGKENVRKILEYGIKKGYESTNQLTDEDVENAIEGK